MQLINKDTILEILKQCEVNKENKTIILPNIQLERKLYQKVAKKLEGIGGKWNKKAKVFVFEDDTLDYFDDICNGDEINIKKEFQFFATPQDIAEQVASYARYNWHETPSKVLKSRILEPSAGKGALISALKQYHGNILVDCYEAFEPNVKYLKENLSENINFLGSDFLQAKDEEIYDCIIMNPPFNNKQYVDHVMKAWKMLNKSGKLIAIVPPSWQNNSNKKETSFKEFVKKHCTEICNLDKGSFKESGTMVETMILIFDN